MKKTTKDMWIALRTCCTSRLALEAAIFSVLAVMTAFSAAMVKEAHQMPALASMATFGPDNTTALITPVAGVERVLPQEMAPEAELPAAEIVTPTPAEAVRAERMIEQATTHTRWFNGRPIRPARVLWMQVTAYSPDARSCGKFADGITATLHSVETNGGNLVAADTRLFPFGTLFSIEGYADGNVVPVMDRGGAIKGHHLDLLMPTHRQAIRWGNQRMPVILWEYADGKPLDDPRKFR